MPSNCEFAIAFVWISKKNTWTCGMAITSFEIVSFNLPSQVLSYLTNGLGDSHLYDFGAS